MVVLGMPEGFTSKRAPAKAKKKPPPLEDTVVKKAIALINAMPRAYAHKTHGNVYKAGQPDIDACVRGRAVKIEWKRTDGRSHWPTERQMQRMRDWQAAGALVGWCSTLDQLRSLLSHVDDPHWCNPLTGPGDPTAGGSTAEG